MTIGRIRETVFSVYSTDSVHLLSAQLEAVYIDDHFILSGIQCNKYLPKAAIWLPPLIAYTLPHSHSHSDLLTSFSLFPRTKKSNKHTGNTLDIVVYPKQREPIFIYLCNCVMSVVENVHLSSRRNVMFHWRKMLSTSFLFSFDPHGKLKFIKEPIGQTELRQLPLVMILNDFNEWL